MLVITSFLVQTLCDIFSSFRRLLTSDIRESLLVNEILLQMNDSFLKELLCCLLSGFLWDTFYLTDHKIGCALKIPFHSSHFPPLKVWEGGWMISSVHSKSMSLMSLFRRTAYLYDFPFGDHVKWWHVVTYIFTDINSRQRHKYLKKRPYVYVLPYPWHFLKA